MNTDNLSPEAALLYVLLAETLGWIEERSRVLDTLAGQAPYQTDRKRLAASLREQAAQMRGHVAVTRFERDHPRQSDSSPTIPCPTSEGGAQ